MIYARITHDLDEDGRLEVDAILGDPDAIRERRDRTVEALVAAGIEFA